MNFKVALILVWGIQVGFSQKTITYDICVYGATSAGIIAAYTAKMQGKSVILLEPSNHIGGLTTGGLGQTDIGNKYAITGLSRDFYREIGQHYGKFEQWTFEPSAASDIFNSYLKKANIKVFTKKQLINVIKSKSTIRQIELLDENKQRMLVTAKYFLDCTYEG
ncbi:MAG: xanthan lyase, partial [Cytophagaceae bacterium BCCC1]